LEGRTSRVALLVRVRPGASAGAGWSRGLVEAGGQVGAGWSRGPVGAGGHVGAGWARGLVEVGGHVVCRNVQGRGWGAGGLAALACVGAFCCLCGAAAAFDYVPAE
jgi:hypothetical protein